jgi:hypothetical protein
LAQSAVELHAGKQMFSLAELVAHQPPGQALLEEQNAVHQPPPDVQSAEAQSAFVLQGWSTARGAQNDVGLHTPFPLLSLVQQPSWQSASVAHESAQSPPLPKSTQNPVPCPKLQHSPFSVHGVLLAWQTPPLELDPVDPLELDPVDPLELELDPGPLAPTPALPSPPPPAGPQAVPSARSPRAPRVSVTRERLVVLIFMAVPFLIRHEGGGRAAAHVGAAAQRRLATPWPAPSPATALPRLLL